MHQKGFLNRLYLIWVRGLTLLVILVLTVGFVVPVGAQPDNILTTSSNQVITTSTFRCTPDAPFQFPVDGYVGWVWKDPAAIPIDGHIHSGIDFWPFRGRGTAVYPLANGYIRRIGNGNGLNALNIWFPDINGGTEVYYTHIKVNSRFIPAHNPGILSIPVNIPVNVTDVIGTVYGADWIHLSISSKNGTYPDILHNDTNPGDTQDPSSYFRAKLNYDAGDRSSFEQRSVALCDPNRNLFPIPILIGIVTTITRTILTPLIPPKPDIVFLADTTGSMGIAISNVKSKASRVMGEVQFFQPNARFGAAEYKDFNCDAMPYRLNQAVTFDANVALAGINMWEASGGCDYPESQLNALYRLATDINGTGWRSDSSRIIAWFGDQPGHDPSNGKTLTDTITALKAAKIRVIAVDVFGLDSCGTEGSQTCGQATAITMATNGRLISLNNAALLGGSSSASLDTVEIQANDGIMHDSASTEMFALETNDADDVSDAILEGLTSLPVTIEPQIVGCGPYITITPDELSKTVTSGESVTFTFQVITSNSIPLGIGESCQINFLANGTLITDSTIAQPINVTTFASVTSENLCAETQRYIRASSLTPRQGRVLGQSLCAQLSAAQSAFNRGNFTAFMNARQAYINEIRAQTLKAFTADQVANLLRLLDYLG